MRFYVCPKCERVLVTLDGEPVPHICEESSNDH